MPLPAKLLKIQMFGKLYGIQDWSTSVFIQGGAAATDPTATDLNGFLGSIWGLTHPPYAAFRPLNFTSSYVTGLKAYWYPNANGIATVQGIYTAGGTSPGTGTNRMPPLCSAVLSLKTGFIGRSYRGRSYMPITGTPALANNGEVTNTAIDAYVLAQKQYFDDLNAITWSGIWMKSGKVVVASATKGVSTAVTSVACDSIVDTQHRRSNDFTPSYTKESALA